MQLTMVTSRAEDGHSDRIVSAGASVFFTLVTVNGVDKCTARERMNIWKLRSSNNTGRMSWEFLFYPPHETSFALVCICRSIEDRGCSNAVLTDSVLFLYVHGHSGSNIVPSCHGTNSFFSQAFFRSALCALMVSPVKRMVQIAKKSWRLQRS